MPTRGRSTHLRSTPSFSGLRAASRTASRTARSASAKQNTRCELQISSELRKLRVKFRANVTTLPGCPDFVFDDARLIVFADGDFWHGRGLQARLARLRGGHNAAYWVKKLLSNVARDRRISRLLRKQGWSVMRVWEGQIKHDPRRVADRIVRRLSKRLGEGGERVTPGRP